MNTPKVVSTVFVAALVTAGVVALGQSTGLPKLAKKATYRVGFAQTESNNP